MEYIHSPRLSPIFQDLDIRGIVFQFQRTGRYLFIAWQEGF